jgi:Mn2+/Fe2+ NRAMP family transporter
MLAATAVGVSHLVYSTQAGGTYGFSLAWLILLIVLLKYPAFRFAVDYASATGHSLVTGYSKISRIALAWLVVGFFVDMFIAVGAVSLVTAGLVISVFNLPFTGPQVAVALMIISAGILINGQYARAERIVKVLVLSFTVLALLATVLALPLIGSDGRGVLAELTPDRSLALFVIAMAGWMPMPTNGAVMSLSFVAMGTAVLFETGREVPSSAAGFATELFGIFTTVIGEWVYPVIAIAGIAVIWSTQVALMDACPRVTGRLFNILTGKPDDTPIPFSRFLIIQVVGVTVMLLFLMGNFTTFLYFATSMGFVASPAIAYYNYRAITSDEIAAEYRPQTGMVLWSWAGILLLSAFAIAFLYTSLG